MVFERFGFAPLQTPALEYADIMLGNARELCEQAGLPDVETEVLMGDPASQILEYAEQNGVDLIVIGQRGLATRHGLLGGVARKIVNTSSISCLIAT
jgi:nucleotide-binding universal stress UspA family protein